MLCRILKVSDPFGSARPTPEAILDSIVPGPHGPKATFLIEIETLADLKRLLEKETELVLRVPDAIEKSFAPTESGAFYDCIIEIYDEAMRS